MSLAMRMRMRSSLHDGRACSCCNRDALYVMEMKNGRLVTSTRFCQNHIDELRAMLSVEPIHVYPKEIIND